MIDRYARPKMKRVWSDESKYDKWLAVELAVCEAWAEESVIPPEDMAKLRGARYNLKRLDEIFQRTRHDVTAFLRSITETLGPEGRWVHLGLTSSDVMDTALSLQMVEAADLLDEDLKALQGVLAGQARRYKDTLMMGRTHGVHAEPITFGLKLALWWDEVRRQRERLAQARREVAVGKISGAVGTHATVPPRVEERACARLGIVVAPLSNQVIQRDRHAHFVTTLALIAASLEKFATEIRHLQRTEVREAEEPFGEGQTGSSAMPHKKNPELSERICGLARLVRGHAVTALENVALWHERDISHSSA
ncbi:MAG: adenylosuccinate lyase, partial [Chloroflexi bacterium]|nr:adenylosuccinate lyase [Chloroflexota bacterium]